jgi:putative transposase
MTSPQIIHLAVMLYVRFPLSLRNVQDLRNERGIEISHENVRVWWLRLGPLFAAKIRRKRVNQMRGCRQGRWHLDEVFVRINGEKHCLWLAVDHEGEVPESPATKTRDRKAALNDLERGDDRETERWANNRAENSHQPFRRRERAMQRFRQTRSRKVFTSIHASVWNHFNQERSLSSRQKYKTACTAALAEWRGLCAA